MPMKSFFFSWCSTALDQDGKTFYPFIFTHADHEDAQCNKKKKLHHYHHHHNRCHRHPIPVAVCFSHQLSNFRFQLQTGTSWQGSTHSSLGRSCTSRLRLPSPPPLPSSQHVWRDLIFDSINRKRGRMAGGVGWMRGGGVGGVGGS